MRTTKRSSFTFVITPKMPPVVTISSPGASAAEHLLVLLLFLALRGDQRKYIAANISPMKRICVMPARATAGGAGAVCWANRQNVESK